MARPPRLDFPGARHHVMNRSSGGHPFLTSDAACALFVDTLAEVPERFGARLHGYALMPNHYHLMIEVPHGNLSKVMRYVGATFTQAYNRHMRTDGPLFRGRFHNRVVETDAYWMHLLAYLALNPVKAGLCPRPEHAMWTHHGAYIGAVPEPEWLTTGELIEHFGSREAVARYVEDVRLHRRDAPDDFDPEHLWSPPETAPVPPRAVEARLDPDQALAQVAAAFDVPVDDLFVAKSGPLPNAPQWVAVWWLVRATPLTQADIGARAGVSRARVGQIFKRALRHAHEDPEVGAIMARLEQGLLDRG